MNILTELKYKTFNDPFCILFVKLLLKLSATYTKQHKNYWLKTICESNNYNFIVSAIGMGQ